MKGRTKFFLALACVLGATVGAGAVAVASGGGGVIRACANNKTGALSLQMGSKCSRASHGVSWNQQGVPGTPGANGLNGVNGTNGLNGTNAASNVVVRTADPLLSESCVQTAPMIIICTGSGTVTATCNAGEKAINGGLASGSGFAVSDLQPNVSSGTPTGWSATASTSGSGSTPGNISVPVPMWVLCVGS